MYPYAGLTSPHETSLFVLLYHDVSLQCLQPCSSVKLSQREPSFPSWSPCTPLRDFPLERFHCGPRLQLGPPLSAEDPYRGGDVGSPRRGHPRPSLRLP